LPNKRYGTKIFSTQDKDTPYRWTLGDGSTISGIELAILGGDDVTPMLPGGIRRVVIPQSLGYQALAKQPKTLCVQDGQPGMNKDGKSYESLYVSNNSPS
jgi:hypothetical protein